MPSFTPGRDLHLEAARPALAARAAARRAGILDHRAVPAAARARLREGEQPLRLRDDTAAAALGARLRQRARLRARSLARRARRLEADGNRRLHAAQRVLEREVELHLDVAAAPAARGLRAHAAAPAAEDPAEQVAEIAEVAEVERERAARPELGTAARRAPGVVLLPLLGVGEDVVGGLHLLEHLLGLGVARVLVRVVLPRELAVGLLDLVRPRRPSRGRAPRRGF